MPDLDTSRWVGSRFNFRTSDPAGALLIYNSYSGAFARIPAEDAPFVERSLTRGLSGLPGGVLAELALNGFFVPVERNELQLADEMHSAQFDVSNILQLILLPNEKCNFRCKYC